MTGGGKGKEGGKGSHTGTSYFHFQPWLSSQSLKVTPQNLTLPNIPRTYW